ncbi:M23 family metallopeptidase [Bdellovibrio sp. HCB-162]|uniref:M23 family metallopeptidase n=1 Tax=Bdellovibrio sp. HCB-162 TaxID=3394234 RepID=UPI0039BC4D4D
MQRKFISQLMSSVLFLAVAPVSFAHAADEMDGTLYLKTNNSIHLFLATEMPNGDRALTSQLNVPEDTILAIDIKDINDSLTLAQSSPERVNYPYIIPGQKNIQKSRLGWACGIRVVDVLDEDLRSSDVIDRTDFCISLPDLRQASSLESNGNAIRQSFFEYKIANTLGKMNSLAKEIDRLRKDREEFGIVDKAGSTETIISPIKNCGKGCIVATSEFGMRRHPVLKINRLHKGIDLRAGIGTQVVSVYSGKVLATRTERNRLTKKVSGYGNYVIVVHPNAKLETLYAHLSAFKTKAGASVNQGDLIALSGNTGIGTAPHLHFETHVQNKRGYTAVNPRNFIGSMLQIVAAFFQSFHFNV